MDLSRRRLLKSGALTATGLSIYPSASFGWIRYSEENGFKDLLSKLITVNDDVVTGKLKSKVEIQDSKWYGGYTNQYDIPNAHSTASFITRGCISLSFENSVYYDSVSLATALESALDCLLRIQYEDGTIDLYSTNFHSTPDTAFIVNDLVPVYKLLRNKTERKTDSIQRKMRTFILNAGKCFLTGGIHTANHRWVVSAALARLYSIDPQQKYIDRMDQWLAEGIDQDEDGQYHEQSVSIYSPICNNMFLAIGKILNRSRFFDIIRRNLEMNLYYIQPGGEVLTEASDRQDKATIAYVTRYYLSYRYFAIADNNGQFSAVCRLIEEKFLNSIVGSIPYLFEFAGYQKELPSPSPLPSQYFRHFKNSGVVRIKKGEWDLSVIEKNPTFMVLMKGDVVLQSVRIAAAFFGSKGQFIPEEMHIQNDRITLKKSITHGYYQPIPKDRATGQNGWVEFPRDDREMSELQTMNYTVTILPLPEKIEMHIEISGTDNVPVSCEMNFRTGDTLSGTVDDLRTANSYFLKEGYARFRSGEETLKFGPGKMEHQWAQMRGMLPKQNGESVYITGITPFKHTIYFS